MRRCTRCIMPDTMPGLQFGENGLCSYCSSFNKEGPRGEEQLQDLIEPIMGKHSRYDVIVPVSGGRDSSYVLFYAVEVLGMRVLAVNGDNEFRHKQADENLFRACNRLGVDLILVRSKRGYGKKITLNRIRAGMKLGHSMGVRGLISSNFCHACSVIVRSAIYSQAESLGVPLILRGDSSPERVGYRVSSQFITQLDMSEKIRRVLSTNFLRDRFHGFELRSEFPVPGNSPFSRRKPVLNNPEIKEVSLFDFIEWDREKIKHIIRSRLGWRKPDESPSSWRFDCRLHDLVDFCFLKAFGCTHNCIGYTNMINSGYMSRREALQQEEAVKKSVKENIEDLLTTIGLSRGEIRRVRSLS